MRTRSKRADIPENFSIWTSFTDLMSNAFMVLTLLLLLVIVDAYRSNEREDAEQKKDDATLFLVIPGTNYPFNSGSAELSSELQEYIRNDVVDFIETNVSKYDNSDENIKVIVEVIGHTDGQPVSSESADLDNLDDELERVAKGEKKIVTLKPGSNADLGLMRALAVMKELQKIQSEENSLRGLSFRPYSAAQLLLPDGSIASRNQNPNASRRRIEIRLTRLREVE